MNINISNQLKKYIISKNAVGISIDVISGMTWQGPYSGIDARLASEQKMQLLKNKGYSEYESDGFKILISSEIFVSEEIDITLKRFLWKKSIIVKGITPKTTCRIK